MEKKFSEKDIAFSEILIKHCNSYNTEYRDGVRVGQLLRSAHRTLQATIFRYMLGIIVGLSEQTYYTDARNEIAVASAKRIAKMVEDGELKIGYMI